MEETTKMTEEQLSELKSKIDNADSDTRKSIITDVIDNYDITDELKSLLLNYKDILINIRESNTIQ